ncbi:MAG: Asp-tRNA(Asn)/Glu-tRNA(Gln) amidotransferase subunit GatB [Bacillota bacterium]
MDQLHAHGGRFRYRNDRGSEKWPYPDLPKGYQISQYAVPLAVGGELVVDRADGEESRIRITRVHLEEDAGKSTHSPETGRTQLDFNRCGIPLAEIVTEPDITSPVEAREFLEELRSVLRAIGVSEVRMEEGELRCDVNFSLRREGDAEGPDRTEISEVKNLNSFRSVQRALEFEELRHREALNAGDTLSHETRHWDEHRGVTYSARSKEEAQDYRYFPEPDLPPLVIDPELSDYLAAQIPELPRARRKRFREEYELNAYDAGVLVSQPDLADFFERTVAIGAPAKETANWILGDISAYLNAEGVAIEQVPVEPGYLEDLLSLIDEGEISGKMAKEVWEETMKEGTRPSEVVEKRGLRQISDESTLETIVAEVIRENPEAAQDYRSGKDKALGYLVGQVMKKTRGQANPAVANEQLRDILRDGGDPE